MGSSSSGSVVSGVSVPIADEVTLVRDAALELSDVDSSEADELTRSEVISDSVASSTSVCEGRSVVDGSSGCGIWVESWADVDARSEVVVRSDAEEASVRPRDEELVLDA